MAHRRRPSMQIPAETPAQLRSRHKNIVAVILRCWRQVSSGGGRCCGGAVEVARPLTILSLSETDQDDAGRLLIDVHSFCSLLGVCRSALALHRVSR